VHFVGDIPSLSTFIITSTISSSLVLMPLAFHAAIMSAVQFGSLPSFPVLLPKNQSEFRFLLRLRATNYLPLAG